MITSTTKNKTSKLSYLNIIVYPLISIIVVLVLWTILSLTLNSSIKIILNPWETWLGILAEGKKPTFWKAIGGTLGKSLFSFVVSFVTALVFALLAHRFTPFKKIINPIISIFRSIPTAAAVLILLLCVGGQALPIAVAILVVLPLSYQQLLTAIEGVNPQLIEMSKVFGISKARQLTNIYLPGILPSLLSAIIASFGLNIKVIIAAEVMGLPTVSIGYMILISKQGFDFGLAFIWLVIAVILSLICELILKVIARFLLPYKYPDQRFVKKCWQKIWHKKGVQND
jgi:NitT/TauT family transport system permease protein